jgi:hypothetical protein
MPGKFRVCGGYRGSGRVQSAPGEPAGWSSGAGQPLIPVAGRNNALENLRSIYSATYLPLAISARVADAGTMGMVHPVLLTQMLVVACGAPCVLQFRKPAGHVLPAGNPENFPTTSASESTIFPLYPWSDRGSLEGAAPAVNAPASRGASPPEAEVRLKTGEMTGHGGSGTTAYGHLCAIPSRGRKSHSLMYPPYISESH